MIQCTEKRKIQKNFIEIRHCCQKLHGPKDVRVLLLHRV
jgi:hypothetical protein